MERRNEKIVNEKSIIVLSIAATVIILVLIFATVFGREKTVDITERLELGNRYMSELNYEQAIVTYEAILEIDPRCVDAYIAMAGVYVAMGDFGKALDVLQQGHDKTESDAIRDQIESLRERLASKEIIQTDEPEDNKTINYDAERTDSEEVKEDEWDVRYEACVVDGIQRCGYSKYDLSIEETEWLEEIIQMSVSGLYNEIFQYVEEKNIVSFLLERYTEYNAVRIAFQGYKIKVEESGLGTEITLIPLDDGMGYMFKDLKIKSGPILREQKYIECECVGGMFEGNYLSKEFFFSENGSIQKSIDAYGNVKNGLLDGEIRKTICKKNDGEDDVEYYVEFYEMGKPKIFDTRYLENGTFECLYGYETDENWAKKEYGGTSWIFYSMGQEQLDNERILINSVRSYSMRPDNIFVLSW